MEKLWRNFWLFTAISAVVGLIISIFRGRR
jgi:hypothetical protein